MATNKKIDVKPISFGMTGFTLEDLLLGDFKDELKKELPTSIITHMAITFSDSKDVIFIGHDRKDGKINVERVDIEGTNSEFVGRIVEILKKVLS
ncbi:MAG: hypothetical protein WC325_03520 [Candidatus Bathyarchaeia archaeon]|jgi:hypothetical protein